MFFYSFFVILQYTYMYIHVHTCTYMYIHVHATVVCAQLIIVHTQHSYIGQSNKLTPDMSEYDPYLVISLFISTFVSRNSPNCVSGAYIYSNVSGPCQQGFAPYSCAHQLRQIYTFDTQVTSYVRPWRSKYIKHFFLSVAKFRIVTIVYLWQLKSFFRKVLNSYNPEKVACGKRVWIRMQQQQVLGLCKQFMAVINTCR